MKRLFTLTTLCLALIAFSGCGKAGIKTVSVHGKITVAGQPLAGGQVSFILDKPGDAKIGMVSGTINNGEYKIFSQGKEGAPEGTYKVTVTPSMMPAPGGKAAASTINPRYQNQKSTPLTITVPSGNYDLKLEK